MVCPMMNNVVFTLSTPSSCFIIVSLIALNVHVAICNGYHMYRLVTLYVIYIYYTDIFDIQSVVVILEIR